MTMHTLDLMGITTWDLRNDNTLKPANTWETLQRCVAHCVACPLHQSRTQTVFGIGNPHADLLVIGEAPGFHEDQQGEPFVGRAGELLNEMLKAIGLSREQIFIANILKCRPPNNRDPNAEEVAACKHFLEEQIDFIQPKLILAVGRIAAQNLLQRPVSLSHLRGSVHEYHSIPVIVTYHPAYLLRTPSDKSKAYRDLLRVREQLEANLSFQMRS